MADLVEIEDARRSVLAACTPLASEPVELSRALGRELVPAGTPLGPGQIRDSNAVALAALADAEGARVADAVTAPDDRAATEAALERAVAEADVACATGGVSVGAHDRDQGSHVLTSMLGAGALAMVPSGEGSLAAGERVAVELLAAT